MPSSRRSPPNGLNAAVKFPYQLCVYAKRSESKKWRIVEALIQRFESKSDGTITNSYVLDYRQGNFSSRFQLLATAEFACYCFERERYSGQSHSEIDYDLLGPLAKQANKDSIENSLSRNKHILVTNLAPSTWEIYCEHSPPPPPKRLFRSMLLAILETD